MPYLVNNEANLFISHCTIKKIWIIFIDSEGNRSVYLLSIAQQFAAEFQHR